MNPVAVGEPLDRDLVFDEIAACRRRLEQERGTRIDDFGHPQGRRNQITEKHCESVRCAGFRRWPSANGGTVSPGDDGFSLRRSLIDSWHRSAFEFAVDSLFGRLRP